MQRNPLDILQRLVTRSDGSARFNRINVVLIGLIVLLVGIVPAFAVTADTTTTADTTASSSTSTTAAAPIVVGESTTTSTTAAATTSTTTATTAPATEPDATAPVETEAEVVEGDLPPEEAGTTVSMSEVLPVLPNPGWPTNCNSNIALLMDRSSSVGDPQYGGNYGNTVSVKNASKSFVAVLGSKARPGNSSGIYVNAFATNVAPVYAPDNRFYNTPNVYADAVTAINNTPFASPPGTGYDAYGPRNGIGRGRTNWQGAMAAVPGGANLIIIVTDGEPTWWNHADPRYNNGATQPDDVRAAVDQANVLKQRGTRIVAVHVGQRRGAWQEHLAQISGPVVNSDYYPTDYAGLDATLRHIAERSCVTPKANSIAIDKTANKTAARPGDPVTYSFKVTNTGDETLAPVTVTDNVLGSIGTIASLAPGANQTLTKAYTVPTAQTTNVVNTATATGRTPGGANVSATDQHTLAVITLKVEKSASKPSAVAGDSVTYSFKVTNTSTVQLTNIEVQDDVLGTIGTIPTLAAGANTTLTKNFTVPAGSGPIVNTVTACALVPGSTTDKACAEDQHTLPRLSIGLTKTASAQTAPVGSTVTYTYIVTNTSGVTLNNLVLTDDKLGKITLPVTTLAAGASTTGTAQYVVQQSDAAPANPSGNIVNVATVTGTDPNGTSVKATAQATVGVVGGTSVSTTIPTPQVKGESLAYTGAGTTSLFTLALMLLVFGGGLLALTKFRRRSATDGHRA